MSARLGRQPRAWPCRTAASSSVNYASSLAIGQAESQASGAARSWAEWQRSQPGGSRRRFFERSRYRVMRRSQLPGSPNGAKQAGCRRSLPTLLFLGWHRSGESADALESRIASTQRLPQSTSGYGRRGRADQLPIWPNVGISSRRQARDAIRTARERQLLSWGHPGKPDGYLTQRAEQLLGIRPRQIKPEARKGRIRGLGGEKNDRRHLRAEVHRAERRRRRVEVASRARSSTRRPTRRARAGPSPRRTSTSTTGSAARSSAPAGPGSPGLLALSPAAAVSGAHHVGGVPARARADRDGLRPEADHRRRCPRVLLPRRPGADAGLADRQGDAVASRRSRPRWNETAPASARTTPSCARRRAATSPAASSSATCNVPVLEGAGVRHVERVIEPREAAVVERIFRLTADGWGVKRIAAALNDEGAPAPMPRRAGRPRGWAPSSVREVLHRDLYRGVLVWNRTARIVRQGARAQRERPAADVVSVTRARAGDRGRRALDGRAGPHATAAAEVYRQRTGGQAFGRPANGVESPYLLTGLGACAACGGSMAVLKRAHGPRGHRRQVPFYGCMTRHLRGDAICANALEVRLADAEEAVLAAVEHDVLQRRGPGDERSTRPWRPSRRRRAATRHRGGRRCARSWRASTLKSPGSPKRSPRAARSPGPRGAPCRSASADAHTSEPNCRGSSVRRQCATMRRPGARARRHADGAHRLAGHAPAGATGRRGERCERCWRGGSCSRPERDGTSTRSRGRARSRPSRRCRRGCAKGVVAPTGFEPVFQP